MHAVFRETRHCHVYIQLGADGDDWEATTIGMMLVVVVMVDNNK